MDEGGDDVGGQRFHLDEIIIPNKKKEEAEEEEEEEIDDSDLLSLFNHDPTNVNGIRKGVFTWPVGKKKLRLKNFPKHYQPDDLLRTIVRAGLITHKFKLKDVLARKMKGFTGRGGIRQGSPHVGQPAIAPHRSVLVDAEKIQMDGGRKDITGAHWDIRTWTRNSNFDTWWKRVWDASYCSRRECVGGMHYLDARRTQGHHMCTLGHPDVGEKL